MKKRLSFICFVVWICIISITVSGCRSRNQNQANDSVVTESASDELTQFREKFTIKNILSLLDNPKNKSFAQKCGLEFILEDTDEYGGYQIIYGYDVEKGEKTDNWYDINALSEHSTYFKYECCESVGWMAYFKSKEDADCFLNEAKKHGFAKKDDCYTNGKWGMSITEFEDWCCCQIYEYVEYEEYEETTENSNSNNGMSESNSQTLSSSEARMFRNEDDVYMNFVSQTFVGNSGFNIRFGGNGEMEIDGDYAGIAQVKSYTSQRALLKYSGGVYGEGFIILSIEGGTARLIDPNNPSSVWYRKRTF